MLRGMVARHCCVSTRRFSPSKYKSGFGTITSEELEREMPGLVRRAVEGDIFESSVNFEELHYQLGFDEGVNAGVVSGEVDGRAVGLKNGFQVGEEIGFYTGCVNIWKAAVNVDSSAFSSRAQRSIKQFQDKLLRYPVSNPEDESLQDLLEDIRVKFQAILSMLAIHVGYAGHVESQNIVDASDF